MLAHQRGFQSISEENLINNLTAEQASRKVANSLINTHRPQPGACHSLAVEASLGALAELADTEGDGALMVVLDQLPPKDVLAVIREFDTSKESVVNLVITPEQFARLETVTAGLCADGTCPDDNAAADYVFDAGMDLIELVLDMEQPATT